MTDFCDGCPVALFSSACSDCPYDEDNFPLVNRSHLERVDDNNTVRAKPSAQEV